MQVTQITSYGIIAFFACACFAIEVTTYPLKALSNLALNQMFWTQVSYHNWAKHADRPQKDSVGIGSLRMRVFETLTATGSELFSLLTCLHSTTFS